MHGMEGKVWSYRSKSRDGLDWLPRIDRLWHLSQVFQAPCYLGRNSNYGAIAQ